MDRKGDRSESAERGFYFYFFFSSFFFLDLRRSDHTFSSGLKAKLIHVARAMRGHQNLGVSLNSMR